MVVPCITPTSGSMTFLLLSYRKSKGRTPHDATEKTKMNSLSNVH